MSVCGREGMLVCGGEEMSVCGGEGMSVCVEGRGCQCVEVIVIVIVYISFWFRGQQADSLVELP